MTRQCLLVRFREHYDKVSYGEELLRKQNILERAIELKTKRENQTSGKKGANSQNAANSTIIIDTKITQLATTELFDYLYSMQLLPTPLSPAE